METAKIEQIKTEQAVFTDLWNIYKKYRFATEYDEIKSYTDETESAYQKYKSTKFEQLFRDMLLSITNQIEKNVKEN